MRLIGDNGHSADYYQQSYIDFAEGYTEQEQSLAVWYEKNSSFWEFARYDTNANRVFIAVRKKCISLIRARRMLDALKERTEPDIDDTP